MEVLHQRKPRSLLDLLKPNIAPTARTSQFNVDNPKKKAMEFNVGDKIDMREKVDHGQHQIEALLTPTT